MEIADRFQKGLEVVVQIFGANSQIPVQKEKHLLLHEVDFSNGEAEVGKATDSGVTSPVLVLWR